MHSGDLGLPGEEGREVESPEKIVSSGNLKHKTASHILISVVNCKVLMETITPTSRNSHSASTSLRIFYFPDTVSYAWEVFVDKINKDFYACGDYMLSGIDRQ